MFLFLIIPIPFSGKDFRADVVLNDHLREEDIFKYEESNDEKIETDFNTGYHVCKNVSNCDWDTRCANTLCNNHGLCYIVFFTNFNKNNTDSSKYCVCNEYYGGKYCEAESCAVTKRELLYAKEEDLCPLKSNDTCKVCNNNACKTYGSYVICECNLKSQAGRFCQNSCDPPCVSGFCTLDDDN
ncbi:hypothetical protein HZS_6201, partial [Henneguya salminicola]